MEKRWEKEPAFREGEHEFPGVGRADRGGAQREPQGAEAGLRNLRILQAITDAAISHQDLYNLLEELKERLSTVLEVDASLILLIDDGHLIPQPSRGAEEEFVKDVRIPLGVGLAGRVAVEGRPIAVEDLTRGQIANPLLGARPYRSSLGVPLSVDGRVIGVLQLATLDQRHFDPEEIGLVQLAAQRMALAIDHARVYERERRLVELLQKRLLPRQLPVLPSLDLAARYLTPSNIAVGGDWYDVIPLAQGRVGLAIGDVVGKGVEAAGLMGRLRSILHVYAVEGYSPTGVLKRVERMVEAREMCTLFYLVFDPAKESITHAGAGHPPAIVLDSQGLTLLHSSSPPLMAGFLSRHRQAVTSFLPGATLLLYTDGLIEAGRNPKEAFERLTGFVREQPRDMSLDVLLDGILQEMLSETPPRDDIALLAVRRKRPV